MMTEWLGLTWPTWIALMTLGVVAPIHGVMEHRALRRSLEAGDAPRRLALYSSTMRWEWGLSAALLGLWMLAHGDLEGAFLGFGLEATQLGAVAVGLLLAAVVIINSRAAERDRATLARVRSELGNLEAIAPTSPAERRAFGWLALSAGVCEELMYRGLLLGGLAVGVGLWPAVAISTIVFGLGHAYQGPAGVIRTGLVGLIMALLTVFSGSIWVAVALHVVVDVFQGQVLAAAVALEPDEVPCAAAP